MKHSIRILLVFLVSSINTFACGPWYPYGEELRFSLINPALFDDGGMSPYYYTSEAFGDSYQSNHENDPNVALWSEYCGGKVSTKSIYSGVYYSSEYEFESDWTSNAFISFLKEKKDDEALSYLAFAVRCSDLNQVDYGWEWDSEENNVNRTRYILEALKKSTTVQNDQIRKRYRFLALRLAYYKGDTERTIAIYDKCFAQAKVDVLDYWSLYFVSMVRQESPQRNFDLAQVFAKAPGKRFGCISGFSEGIPLSRVLLCAKTDKEKADVYAMYAVRDRARSLESIKKIHTLDPNHPLLTYLITREVNKLEDWVLTPRYTRFPPAMHDGESIYGENETTLLQERVTDDQAYAKQFLAWMGTVKLEGNLIVLFKAYVSGISGSPSNGLGILGDPQSFSSNYQNMANQIKLILKVQANANSPLTASEKFLLMDNASENHNSMLFAVAREYEYQQKYADAAALFSHVNQDTDYYEEGVSWRASNNSETLYSDFYTTYFFYLDGEYSPDQVQSVIDFAQKKSDNFSEYDLWQRSFLKRDLNRLYDLLGTKFVRQNKMDAAISAFKNVKSGLWDSDDYYYSTYLNANPFHADFYSGHSHSVYDTVTYNKLEILQLYQSYLAKAENPTTKNRAYYYFLLANCELNMSHYGNSWMMRRYYWTSNLTANNLEDDDEFYRVKRAKQYYLKARELSSDAKIKALCTRMAGRCEGHQLYFDTEYDWEVDYDQYGGFENFIFGKNKFYKELETKFPDDSEELLGNCYSFQRYFALME